MPSIPDRGWLEAAGDDVDGDDADPGSSGSPSRPWRTRRLAALRLAETAAGRAGDADSARPGETTGPTTGPTAGSSPSRPTSPSPSPRWSAGSAGPAPAAPRLLGRMGGLGASSEPTGAPRPPSGPFPGARLPGVYLSPRMTAIFGGLFGLATVTSIIALLIQVVPPKDERAAVEAAGSGAPTASAATVAARAALEAKRPKRVAIPGPWRVRDLEKDPSMLVAGAAMERRGFLSAVADKGVPKAQIYRVMKAFDGLRKFDKPGKKDRFTVGMERASRRVKAFEYEVSPLEVYQAREDDSGLLVAVKLDMHVAEAEVVNAFYVGKDLAASYQAAGLEDGILDALDDAFAGHISTESFEEGGTVRVIAQEQTALGLFASYKGVVAAEYRAPDPAKPPMRVYRFQGEQSRGYFDDKGRQPQSGGWRLPCPGAPITSPFNPKRMHPVLKKTMPHNGTDYGAPTGTPVYAAYRGTVEWVGPAGAGGNLVTILHANGIETGYAHLSKFAAGLKKGDKVGTFQLVGYVGSTGRSTGPHLHLSAKRDGKFFDVTTLQLDGIRVMPATDRPAFLAAKAELDKRLDAIALPDPPPEPVAPLPADTAAAAAGSAAPGASGADAAPAAPGIHPSGMVEDPNEDDAEEAGDQDIAAPALGPGATAKPATPPRPDPAESEE
jgi:murein DD-endopeptidase MepM/ murein hydrolase activator NlpD